MGAFDIIRVVLTVAAGPLLPPRALPPLPPLPPPSTQLAGPATSSSFDQDSLCFAPFFYSGDGIKRYVVACLSPAGSANDAMVPDCTVPYTFDEAGRHHYIAACMDVADEPCALPFAFDAEGTKHYKSECLSD